jgi:hypothetical protein
MDRATHPAPTTLARRLSLSLRRRHPIAACDVCLAREVGASVEETTQAASLLAQDYVGFVRRTGWCWSCYTTREITCLM